MKNNIILVGALLLLFGFFFFINNGEEVSHEEDESTENIVRHESSTFGFTFEYRSDPNGYTLLIPATEDEESETLLERIVLINTQEYEELQASTDPREGPPTIGIAVYDNINKRQPSVWAHENQNASNINVILGEEEETTLAGANAIRYEHDGLYVTKTAIVASNGYLYVLTGQFSNREDVIVADYEKLLQSFRFIQPIGDLIIIDSPQEGDPITSPLTIKGEARGYWFFEANFPISLTNWDGLIIAEHYAEAKGEWMTEEFVPFEATIEFEKPEFGERGTLILSRSNASGLPEHDRAHEITVFFE